MRYSEAIRGISLMGFKRTSSLKCDAARYCIQKGWIDPESAIINQVALRLAFGQAVTTHVLTDGVVARIKSTEIISIPKDMPKMLREPFIVEARPNSVLIDNIVSISGYISEDDLFLIGTVNNGYSFVQHILGGWGVNGRKIPEIEFAPTVGESDPKSRRTDCFRFVLTLSLLLEAEKTPLLLDNWRKRKKNRKNDNKKNNNNEISSWIERRVYIDTKYVPALKQKDECDELDKCGKILKPVHVRGFLRYQACGPNFEDRKWIYIEGFDSHRWGEKRNTRIIIDRYEMRGQRRPT